MRILIVASILIAFSAPAFSTDTMVPNPLLIAGADTNENNKPEDGSLVIPGEEEKDESEKKCLNVCKQWGEDCIINPRTGARNCRRTCKDFGMECF